MDPTIIIQNNDDDDVDDSHQNLTIGLIQQLSIKLDVSEPALRLLLSVLFGYPIAIVYRQFVYNNPSKLINQLYLMGCGLAICIFNYGWDFYHSLIAIIMTYLLVNFIGNPKWIMIINFVFHMGYLLIGYYFTGTETYDIKWTMPHCVLVLRLIGLAFDVADGKRPLAKLSAEQQKAHLVVAPNLFEIASFTYFPASILVGPQFPYYRYRKFLNKEYQKYTQNFQYGMKRFAFGILYLSINQIGSMFINDAYLLSDKYNQLGIVYKLFILGCWGRLSLYKYISCWLLSEGCAACFGLTFVGVKENGVDEDWSACANIKLSKFELSGKFQHYVESFNVNTNHWIAEYIYKRLKFLGNRYLSHAGALFFLAIWHGFHSGYYACFLMEFIVINFEREIQSVLMANESFVKFSDHPMIRPIIFLLLRVYAFVGMGWCLIPFIFLTYSRWMHVFSTVYYLGLICFVPYPIYKFLLQMILPPTQIKKEKKSN